MSESANLRKIMAVLSLTVLAFALILRWNVPLIDTTPRWICFAVMHVAFFLCVPVLLAGLVETYQSMRIEVAAAGNRCP